MNILVRCLLLVLDNLRNAADRWLKEKCHISTEELSWGLEVCNSLILL